MTHALGRARNLIGATIGAAGIAGVLFACSFTQSLDYLQKGDGGSGVVPVVDGDGPNPEAGGDGGAGRVPVIIADTLTKPGFVVLDANNVYWISDGSAFSVPKTGGTRKLLGAVPPNARSLAADTDPAGFVFVATGTDVLRLPKDGSGADGGVVVFAPGSSATIANTLAADDSALFVLQNDPNGVGVDTRILRMAKDGGGPTDISGDGGATTLTVDPTSVIWLSADTTASAFIQHAKAAPAGMGEVLFALGPDDSTPALSSEIAIDDTFLYWIALDASQTKPLIVSRKRQASASVVTVYIAPADATLEHLAVDAQYLYVLDTHAATLLRIAKTGGEAVTLLAGLKQPSSLAADATGIYLTVAVTGNMGQLLKVEK